MLINTDDVNKVIRRLEDRDDSDETRLMYVEGEYLTPSLVSYPSLRLCSGYEDEQIFYAGELQPDRFTSIKLDHLHALLTSVQNGTATPRPLIDHLDKSVKGVIDLGGMIEEKNLVDDLQRRMRYANWASITQGGIEGIRSNLLQLCRHDSGVIAANALWDKYAPKGYRRPDFLNQVKYPFKVQDTENNLFASQRAKKVLTGPKITPSPFNGHRGKKNGL